MARINNSSVEVVKSVGDKFYALGQDVLLESPNGMDWSEVYLDDILYDLQSVDGDANEVAVIGSSYDGDFCVYKSVDGSPFEYYMQYDGSYGPSIHKTETGYLILEGDQITTIEGTTYIKNGIYQGLYNKPSIFWNEGRYHRIDYGGGLYSSDDGIGWEYKGFAIGYAEHSDQDIHLCNGLFIISYANRENDTCEIATTKDCITPLTQTVLPFEHSTPSIKERISSVMYNGDNYIITTRRTEYNTDKGYRFYTTTDFQSWESINPGVNVTGIVPFKGRYYGVDDDDVSGYYYVSDDLSSWVKIDGIEGIRKYPAVTSDDIIVIYGSNGIHSSTDGITWESTPTPDIAITGLFYNGSNFCAINYYNELLVSSDAINWEVKPIPHDLDYIWTVDYYNVSHDNTIYLLACHVNGGGTLFLLSSDDAGDSWNLTDDSFKYYDIKYFIRYIKETDVVVGFDDTNATLRYTEDRGRTWNESSLPSDFEWTDVVGTGYSKLDIVHDGSRYILFWHGDNATINIAESIDLSSWEMVPEISIGGVGDDYYQTPNLMSAYNGLFYICILATKDYDKPTLLLTSTDLTSWSSKMLVSKDDTYTWVEHPSVDVRKSLSIHNSYYVSDNYMSLPDSTVGLGTTNFSDWYTIDEPPFDEYCDYTDTYVYGLKWDYDANVSNLVRTTDGIMVEVVFTFPSNESVDSSLVKVSEDDSYVLYANRYDEPEIALLTISDGDIQTFTIPDFAYGYNIRGIYRHNGRWLVFYFNYHTDDNYIIYSTDGVTWDTPIPFLQGEPIEYMEVLGSSLFVGHDDAKYSISEDGVTWDEYNIDILQNLFDDFNETYAYYGYSYNSNVPSYDNVLGLYVKWVSFELYEDWGNNNTERRFYIFTSENLIDWVEVQTPAQDVEFSKIMPIGGKFLVICYNYADNDVGYITEDFINYTSLNYSPGAPDISDAVVASAYNNVPEIIDIASDRTTHNIVLLSKGRYGE